MRNRADCHPVSPGGNPHSGNRSLFENAGSGKGEKQGKSAIYAGYKATCARSNWERPSGLAIIAGHAFQNLNTPQEQVACLQCIYRHLKPGGRLLMHLDHQDFGWLGGLVGEKGGVFEPAEQFQHARTGHLIRALRAWAYEPGTQTALCTTAWETLGADGEVVERWNTEPKIDCTVSSGLRRGTSAGPSGLPR